MKQREKTTAPQQSGELPFKDVKSGDWFFDSVKYVYEHKLFSGASDNIFAHAECNR